jgi:hypothetical protein
MNDLSKKYCISGARDRQQVAAAFPLLIYYLLFEQRSNYAVAGIEWAGGRAEERNF